MVPSALLMLFLFLLSQTRRYIELDAQFAARRFREQFFTSKCIFYTRMIWYHAISAMLPVSPSPICPPIRRESWYEWRALISVGPFFTLSILIWVNRCRRNDIFIRCRIKSVRGLGNVISASCPYVEDSVATQRKTEMRSYQLITVSDRKRE